MPNDVTGGANATPAAPTAAQLAAAKAQTGTTPHQSFMTVVGQAIAVTLLVEVAGTGPTAAKIVTALIVGLWLAFLVNNSTALFGALTVKRS